MGQEGPQGAGDEGLGEDFAPDSAQTPQSGPRRKRYESTEYRIFLSGIGAREDWPHRKRTSMETLSVPEVNLDYCFLRDTTQGRDYSAGFVGRDVETKFLLAYIAPMRGG